MKSRLRVGGTGQAGTTLPIPRKKTSTRRDGETPGAGLPPRSASGILWLRVTGAVKGDKPAPAAISAASVPRPTAGRAAPARGGGRRGKRRWRETAPVNPDSKASCSSRLPRQPQGQDPLANSASNSEIAFISIPPEELPYHDKNPATSFLTTILVQRSLTRSGAARLFVSKTNCTMQLIPPNFPAFDRCSVTYLP